MAEKNRKSRFFMKCQNYKIMRRNHVSGLQTGEILVNFLRCRAMLQIIGPLVEVHFVTCYFVLWSCGFMAVVGVHVA